VIQWIRGQLTASYVGEPSTLVLPSGGASQRRYRPRVFRAAVRDVELIASPPDGRPPRLEQAQEPGALAAPPAPVSASEPAEPARLASTSEPVDFRQPRIDEAHVTGVRGGGTFFLGALFDVRVNDLRLSYPTDKAGRAYGLMTGTVTACLVLPALPEPELAPDSKLIEAAAAPLVPGELHVVPQSADASALADEAALAGEPIFAPERERAGVALTPWLAVAAAVCLGLALSCGAMPAALWAVFMLPTLAARRLFASMLPDTRGIHITGAVLVVIQLACAAGLFHTWWASDCRALSMLPLLGVIAVLFPAGLMPSPIPLAINAASLSLILFGWCSAADGPCGESASTRAAHSSETAHTSEPSATHGAPGH